MKSSRLTHPALVVISAIAASCGGGSVDPTTPTAVGGASQTAATPAPAPAPALSPAPAAASPNATTQSAEGLWQGTAGNLSGATVVLENGQYWVIYLRSGVIQGLVQGSSQASNGTFVSADAKDFSAGVVTPMAVSGLYTARQSFAGVAAATSQGTLNFSLA
jgi:hypothetical protein